MAAINSSRSGSQVVAKTAPSLAATDTEDRATVGTDPSAEPPGQDRRAGGGPLGVLRLFFPSPSGLAPGDKSLAATAASLRSAAPGKVVRISGKTWSKSPERAEPYELRGSRTDLWGTGGEIPPVYPATTVL